MSLEQKKIKIDEFNKNSPEVELVIKKKEEPMPYKFEERNCEKCNEPYVPTSARQKNCPKCIETFDIGAYQRERKEKLRDQAKIKQDTKPIETISPDIKPRLKPTRDHSKNVLVELVKLIEEYKLSLSLEDFKNWVMKQID
jgi:PHP family Zn ribbon phosphoesterase